MALTKQRKIYERLYYQKNKNKITKNKSRLQKEKRKLNPELVRQKDRKKYWLNHKQRLSHSRVMEALKSGKLKKPKMCEHCEKEIKLDAHHSDYSKALEVIWLCRICHVKEHERLKNLSPN